MWTRITAAQPLQALAATRIKTVPVLIAAAASVLLSGSLNGVAQETVPPELAELSKPVPIPKQVPAKQGHVEVAGARLWYWDTGGDGVPVVLLHPATGSGLVWEYQQPVFANAGYRVIAYSRKNYVHSKITDPQKIESDVADLHGLVQALRLGKFHLVGLAAGGGIAMEYSVLHPDKLLSMTIACSLGRVNDITYQKASSSLRPPSFYALPAEVRELGPCYRSANPAGVTRWVELAKQARSSRRFLSGTSRRAELTWAKLNATKVPTLLLGGDADLYMPPPMIKYFHDRLPGSEMVIIHGCGHSAYWEQPFAFNSKVLGFLGKH